MIIDPRVARARAKATIEDMATYEVNVELMHACIMKFIKCYKGINQRREFRRLLTRTLLPEIQKLAPTAHMGVDSENHIIFVPAILKSPDGSLDVGFTKIDLYQIRLGFYVQLRISQHALARMMQRGKQLDFDHWEKQLMIAASFVDVMYTKIIKENWKQIGIPRGNDLFVCSRKGELIEVETWFQVGANDRKSKWDKYCKVFDLLTDRCNNYDEFRTEFQKVDFVSKFNFITKEYEFSTDPLDQIWLQAEQANEII